MLKKIATIDNYQIFPNGSIVSKTGESRMAHSPETITEKAIILNFHLKQIEKLWDNTEKVEKRRLWLLKEKEEIEKQNRESINKLVEEREVNRKTHFLEIKRDWTYRHVAEYRDNAIKSMNELTSKERNNLKHQILNDDVPARWDQSHTDAILAYLRSLVQKS